MAVEFSRETSVRKVCPDPANGTDHVKLKVLDKISFIDAKSQHQEYQFSFNNGPLAARVTFAEKAGDDLDVERIEKLSVIDPKDFFQESLFSFLRYQEGVHLKTHKRKIYALKADGTKDEGIWIEVERVDQISFVDPKTQHQEYVYELKWPDLADTEWDYQDLTPVVTEHDKTSINPPWRLDPFQNIVNSSFGGFFYAITILNTSTWSPDLSFDVEINGANVMSCGFTTSAPEIFYPETPIPEFLIIVGGITDAYTTNSAVYARDPGYYTWDITQVKTYSSFSSGPVVFGLNTLKLIRTGSANDMGSYSVWIEVWKKGSEPDMASWTQYTVSSLYLGTDSENQIQFNIIKEPLSVENVYPE